MTISNVPRKSTVIQFAPFPEIEIDEIEVNAYFNLTGVLYSLKLNHRVMYAHHDNLMTEVTQGIGVSHAGITTYRIPINAADLLAWVNGNKWEQERVDSGHWIFRAPVADTEGGTQWNT